MYNLILYKTSSGNEPVIKFFESLNKNEFIKVNALLEALEKYGKNLIDGKHAKLLRNGIFELRIMLDRKKSRILYFFYLDENIIITNGFIKKSQEQHDREIKLAIERKKDYISRQKGK